MAEEAQVLDAQAQEAPSKNIFPGMFKSKFPKLHVFGQFSDTTTEDEVCSFLNSHGIATDYIGVSVSEPAKDGVPAEGVAIIKMKGAKNHAIIPFGMLLAVAEGSHDFMIIHPQVFITFFEHCPDA